MDRWQEAALGLARQARARGDCAGVRLIVAADGAELVFATRDGREAVRRISEPADLAPALSALEETGDVGPPPGPPPPAIAAATAGLQAVTRAPAPPPEGRAPLGMRWALELGLAVSDTATESLTFGTREERVVHSLSARAFLVGLLSLRLAHWEIGPLVGLALADQLTPIAGVNVGRRWDGPGAFVVVAGARGAVALPSSGAEPFLGAYLGGARAVSRSLRLRAEIAGYLGVPAAALSVGVER